MSPLFLYGESPFVRVGLLIRWIIEKTKQCMIQNSRRSHKFIVQYLSVPQTPNTIGGGLSISKIHSDFVIGFDLTFLIIITDCFW